MSLVDGEPDPQSAGARRASQSVAPTATPASEISQQSNREPARNATRATAKRRAIDNERAIHVVSENSSTRDSALTSDASAEHSKHLKLDITDESMDSDYREALRILKDNPPEQRLEIHMPLPMYVRLQDAYSLLKLETNISDDQRYPYLSYNSLTETVTVVTVPNYAHEVARNIVPLGSTTTDDFDDGGVVYNTAIDASSGVTIASEVGISQSYKSLCDAKDVWINGHHVKVCILVYVNELSRFRNPRTAYHGIEDVRTEITTMKQNAAEQMRRHESHGYYGPIVYRRHKWAGELNEAFIEIWRPGNSSPDRYELIKDGFACHNLPANLGINMSDMVNYGAWEAAGTQDREIPRFRRFIRSSTN
ncbi:hypothetical protein V1508DRAFT_457398 [Lipomyces doorenjongii]|uniref:uncharacterized protein n=1 Tax=Lipomyces doorenjongii TaxID=383834 RepID=UPI0034CDF760